MGQVKKINVAMLTSDFPLDKAAISGGVAAATFRLVKAQMEQGEINITVVLPNAQEQGFKRSSTFMVDGILVQALVAPGWLPRDLRITYGMEFILRHYFKKKQFDLVHIQNRARWVNCTHGPHVLTIHGINEKDTMFRGKRVIAKLRSAFERFGEGRSRRRVKNIIAVSPYVEKFIDKKKQTVFAIPNPVDPGFFNINYTPKSGLVLCPAVISPLKNTMGLIQAFKQLTKKSQNAELLLAGKVVNQNYYEKCKNMVRQMGIEDKVKFLGTLEQSKMIEAMSLAHCVALVSHQENAPLAISEAMVVGVPVLASRLPGIQWMINDGIHGRLIDPKNIDDIAANLIKLTTSDDTKKMSQAAKKRGQERFDPFEIADETQKIYQKLLH